MLHSFLTSNRDVLINLCKAKVSARRANAASGLENGVPRLLDQIIQTLQAEEGSHPSRGREISGNADGSGESEIGRSAALHGRDLLEHGYTVEQVVHDYGDLCQAITATAVIHGKMIGAEEFETLNRCLDNAMADAVRAFGMQRDLANAEGGGRASSNQRMGFLAHELRNLLNTATLAAATLKSGYVGSAGATSAVLDRSHKGMAALIERALAEVRATAGLPPRKEIISLAGFINEAGMAASLEAKSRGCTFSVAEVDRNLGIEVDRDLLSAALANLLQNAFKFTHPGSNVALRAYASGERARIDVKDHCGGLPPGSAEYCFDPFSQSGKDKSGLGLGLTISRRSVEASNGTLTVKDLPGSGCVFTISLPLHALPDEAPERSAYERNLHGR